MIELLRIVWYYLIMTFPFQFLLIGGIIVLIKDRDRL